MKTKTNLLLIKKYSQGYTPTIELKKTEIKPEEIKQYVFVNFFIKQSTITLKTSDIHLQAFYFYGIVFPFFQNLLSKNKNILFKSMLSFSFSKKKIIKKNIKRTQKMIIQQKYKLRTLDKLSAFFFWKQSKLILPLNYSQPILSKGGNVCKYAKLLQNYSNKLKRVSLGKKNKLNNLWCRKSISVFYRRKKTAERAVITIGFTYKHRKLIRKQLNRLQTSLQGNKLYHNTTQKQLHLSQAEKNKLLWLKLQKNKKTATNAWARLCARVGANSLRVKKTEIKKIRVINNNKKIKNKQGKRFTKPRRPLKAYLRWKNKKHLKKLNKRYLKSYMQSCDQYSKLINSIKTNVLTGPFAIWKAKLFLVTAPRHFKPVKTKNKGTEQEKKSITICAAVRGASLMIDKNKKTVRITTTSTRRLFTCGAFQVNKAARFRGSVRGVYIKKNVSVETHLGISATTHRKKSALIKQKKKMITRRSLRLRKHGTFLYVKRRRWLCSKRSASTINKLIKNNVQSNSGDLVDLVKAVQTKRGNKLTTINYIQLMSKKRLKKIKKKLRKRYKRNRAASLKTVKLTTRKVSRKVFKFILRKQKRKLLRKKRKFYKFFFSKFKNRRRRLVKYFNKGRVRLHKKKWERFALFEFKSIKDKPIIIQTNPRRHARRSAIRSSGASMLTINLNRVQKSKLEVKNFIKYYLSSMDAAYTSVFEERSTTQVCRRGRRFLNTSRQRLANLFGVEIIQKGRADVKQTTRNPLLAKFNKITKPVDGKYGRYFSSKILNLDTGKNSLMLTPGEGFNLLKTINYLRFKKHIEKKLVKMYMHPTASLRRLRKVAKLQYIAPLICKKNTRKVLHLTSSKTKNLKKLSKLVVVTNRQRQRNKNVSIQKKNNKVYKTRRYVHLNILSSLRSFKVKRQKIFEVFKEWRIHSRFWPEEAKNRDKRLSFLKKKKENYLLRLKLLYSSFFLKINKNKLLQPNVSSSSTRANLRVVSKNKASKPNHNSTNISTDLSRKFIEILWKAQWYHRDVFQKQILANRWKFKKKFWIWHKYMSRVQGLKFHHGMSELPSLFLHLVKSGLFSSLISLRRVSRFNTILVNGSFVYNEYYRMQVGDIIQVCPNLRSLVTTTSLRRSTLFKRLKKYKRTQKIVIQSQWRDRRESAPNFYANSHQINYFSVPSWTHFDFFTSSIAVIGKPNQVQSVQQLRSTRYMLDKLTPWRLKI